MNPPNPFGSSQSGAFQAPSSAVKPSLFQPVFGQQQTSTNPNQQTTSAGFFGTGFGQSSSSVFGQAPAFGRPPAAPSAPQQTPAFGQQQPQTQQQQQQQQSHVFGRSSGAAPAFGQTSTSQGSVFGEAPSFGATFGSSGFGQRFGSQSSGFGTQQPPQTAAAPQFGQTPSAVSSTLGFGQQPAFGQTTSTTTSSAGIFGSSSVTQSRGFGSSDFSFKPSNEALFKPIISASPEPTTTTVSSSAFGAASTTSASSGLFSSSKPTTGGFSFSQPAAVPAAQQPLAPGANTAPQSSGLHFTFSQPASPQSNKGAASVNQPTTPSSFSFTAKTLQTQTKPLFGQSKFGQSFGESKDKESEEREGITEPTVETNVFARISKTEATAAMSSSGEKEVLKELPEEGPDRQQLKRPLVRTRGPPPGLFGRALSGLRRDASGAPKREAKQAEWEEAEGQEPERPRMEKIERTERTATPPRTTAAESREQEERNLERGASAPSSSADLQTPPLSARAVSRRESTDGDSSVLQCKNVPPKLNHKGTLGKHFGVFGKILRIYSKPHKNLAIVHFQDHASAVRAKKNGRMLDGHELLLLWQKKKHSPGDKGSSRGHHHHHDQQQRSVQDEAGPEQIQVQVQSPMKRPTLRPPALSSSLTFSSPMKKSRPLQLEESQSSSDLQTPERPVECPVERPVPTVPVPSSLLPLVGQTAETVEEKYQLLEQRDKILRQGRPKRTDLHLSSVFVGTCPDMCPEKERYMRETRKQLSIYEVLPNTEMVDHSAAIKEYSRSSADQEEPLPHELRPLPVLSRTMDYLVTQILDQGQDNYRDWYDFVWNRTRGIRKDITQQHLCCPETVALIEKCTRFHVHCAHELCEEHMSSFDAKINNENMTKCLQSLKEMYQDLATAGVYCPLEAEIRQYNVLLKLNDGDIQREVQQFRDSVRNSPEVKFAVQAAQAVNNNNFVRFFKLVKSASYLPACLLHRYFNQVRSRALRTLNVAYTVGTRSTAFPLDDIVRMLMFPNGEVASAFIQQHGLNVSDGVVELNRTSFQDPELPVSPRRSEVIRSKRRVLIGEVVNGGALPNPPEHRPVCSFDHNDKFKGEQQSAEPPPYRAPVSFRPPAPEAQPVSVRTQERPSVFGVTLVQSAPPQSVSQATPLQSISQSAPLQSVFQTTSTQSISQTAPIQSMSQPSPLQSISQPSPLQSGPEETGESSLFLPAPERQFQPIPEPEPPVPVKVPTPPPPKPVYNEEDIQAEVNSVIEEVTDVAVREVAEAAFCYTSAALEVSSDQVEALVCEVTENLLNEISSNEIKLEEERIAEEKRRIEEARRKREHEAFLIDYSFSLCSELVYEVLDETIEETAASEIKEAVDEKAALISRCTEEVCSVLIEETADIDIAALVEEVLDIELQRIHKYIKRWREVVGVRRQLKRQMRAFPAAPCFVDPRCKLRALAPSAENNRELLLQGLVNLGHAGTLSVSTTRSLKLREEVIHKLRVQYFHQLLLEASSWSPLDLHALATKHIPTPPVDIFWKCLLLLPSEHETAASESDRVLCDWLAVKLGSVSPLPPNGFLHTLCQSSSVQETPHGAHTVHIAVKVSSGPLSSDGLSKMEDCCDLQGSSALLMLLPVSPLLDLDLDPDQDEALLSALLQLKQLQHTSPWSCPLPLVLLVPGLRRAEEQKEQLAEALMLPKLVEDGLISEFSFFFISETTSDLQGSRQLSSAVSWLLSRAPPSPPLSCQTLLQLVESGLSREVSSRVLQHRQERSSSSLPPQRPLPVIRLYNATLRHLAECASSSELSRLSWPPLEFCTEENVKFVPQAGWNCPEHLKWIRERILSLQLPLWDEQAPTGSWSDLCSSIVSFAAQLPSSPRSQPLLMSRLENLLERLRFRAQTRTSTGSLALTVPWDDILELCIDHKLKDWSVQEPPPCEDCVTEDGQILVYFLPDALSSFSVPEDWTEALKETHREKHHTLDTGASSASWAPDVPSSLQKRLFFTSQTRERPPESVLDVSYTPTPEEAQLHRVRQQLEEEKQRSNKVMEKFQLWSEGEALVQLQFPMFLPSSTLLRTPTLLLPTTGHTGHSRAQGNISAAAAAQVFDESSESPKRRRASLPWRLEDVERELRAGREAERVCKLQLSLLQNIVND